MNINYINSKEILFIESILRLKAVGVLYFSSNTNIFVRILITCRHY